MEVVRFVEKESRGYGRLERWLMVEMLRFKGFGQRVVKLVITLMITAIPLGISPPMQSIAQYQDSLLSEDIVSVTYDVLLHEDYEDNVADGWSLDPEWRLINEGGNIILSGSGHSFARFLEGKDWTNYAVKLRFKLLGGSFHFNIRETTEIPYTRYFVGVRQERMYFQKQLGKDFFPLADSDVGLVLGKWYTLEAVVNGTSIKIYLDDELKITYNDDELPIRKGGISFETLDSSPVYFDEISVEGGKIFQRSKWVKTGGPLGGLGYDVRINPSNKSIMFVTDNPSGVQKSYDGGKTWSSRNKGITSRTGPSGDGIPNFCLTIDPNNPNIVWAGMQGMRGIYKSTDGGETWTKKDNGIREVNEITLRGFAVRPNDSNTVFVASEITTGVLGTEFDITKGKIYKTDDGGENWYCVWEGDNLARVIIFDPSNPDMIYASTGIFDREAYNTVGVGIVKSVDGGRSWAQINNGLDNLFVGFLDMHPRDPQILFAAADNKFTDIGGIFKTVNGGGVWKKILGGSDHFSVVVVSPSDPEVIYAGSPLAFYRSDDGGSTWQRYNKPEENCWGPPGIRAGFPISAVVDPADPMNIFVNNYGGGLFKSTDGGKTWIDASKGYTGAHLHDIDLNPSNPFNVYTIGRSGPFRSFDGGESWEGLTWSANLVEWYAVAINPKNPDEVIITDEFDGQILKSEDYGNTWKMVFKHPSVFTGDSRKRHGFRVVAYAPSNPRVVYAGMSQDRRAVDGSLPSGPSFGMYKSIDGGDSWVEINGGLDATTKNIMDIAIDPSNPDIAYIGTRHNGIYATTDGGKTWIPHNNGLMSMDVRSLAIDPADTRVIFAGLGEGAGIYRTTDGGETWNAVNRGIVVECPSYLQRVGQVKLGISLAKPKRIVAQDYYSLSWSKITSIVVDPTDTKKIFAADEMLGVYVSIDGGNSWIAMNDGLSTRAVAKLVVSKDGNLLYAATIGEGVFKLELVTPAPTLPPKSTPTPLPSPTSRIFPCPGGVIAIFVVFALFLHSKLNERK